MIAHPEVCSLGGETCGTPLPNRNVVPFAHYVGARVRARTHSGQYVLKFNLDQLYLWCDAAKSFRCGFGATDCEQAELGVLARPSPRTFASGTRRGIILRRFLKPNLLEKQIRHQSPQPGIFELKFGESMTRTEFLFKSSNLVWCGRCRGLGPYLAPPV
jgi:hypothetical protein